MKLRIRDIAELVLYVGVGSALVRACGFDRPIVYYGLRDVIEPLLATVTVVGAVVIGLESLTRKTEKAWGIGRWTWMVAGLYVLIDVATDCGLLALTNIKLHKPQTELVT